MGGSEGLLVLSSFCIWESSSVHVIGARRLIRKGCGRL